MSSVAHPPPRPGVPGWLEALLPGEFLIRTHSRRSLRDWIVDALMLLSALAVSAMVVAEFWDDHSRLGLVLDLVAGSASFAALWWRRSHPVAVCAALSVVSVASTAAVGPALVAFFNAAIRAPIKPLCALAGLSLVGGAVFALLYPDDGTNLLTDLAIGVLVTVVVGLWGLFIRARRQLILSLRDRAAKAEAEQRLRVEQARSGERRRIAREMHDVLAHRVSLLSVHAGALEYRPDAPPAEIAEAAGVVRATARQVLEDLRGVIGVLREDDGDGGGVAPERPQPTLADVPALIEESRAAGMRVRSLIAVAPERPVPDALGRTAYRIVQEGLTNARKHAPGAAVDLSVRTTDAGLELAVVNSAAVSRTAAEPVPGTGTGLVGLAERVELAGGELRHGAGGDGSFVLHATLPMAR
jgi:signal transduction histidine kinase